MLAKEVQRLIQPGHDWIPTGSLRPTNRKSVATYYSSMTARDRDKLCEQADGAGAAVRGVYSNPAKGRSNTRNTARLQLGQSNLKDWHNAGNKRGRQTMADRVHELLTPDNCVVALIDHQPQMLFGVANFNRQSVINNTVGLAKAAKLFNVPTVLSTVETLQFSGFMWPQLRAVFPDAPLYERTSMNAWEDAPFKAAIVASGRRKIVLAGLWTEVCVAFPAIQAIAEGYEVYVVEDACGDISEVAHRAAMQRVVQAGAVPMTWLQTMLEWQRDWARTATYAGVVEIARAHGGAYGIGIEYAATMLPAHREMPVAAE